MVPHPRRGPVPGLSFKPSRYTFWASLPGNRHLLFSGVTGALLELTRKERGEVERFFQHPAPGVVRGSRLAKALADGGFLVEAERDETAELVTRGERARRAPSVLNLQVVPTYECNFRCTYCYVDFRRGRMSFSVADAVVRHVESRLPRYREVNLTWFGGEPLLCLETIESLTQRVRDLADSRGVAFRGFVATNGHRLTAEAAARLCAAGARYLHVTVDGPAEQHDRHRVLAGGRGTYQRIMANLRSVLERVPEAELTLRMNANESNVGDLEEVLHEVPPPLRRRLQLNVTPVRQPGARVRLELRRHINRVVRRGLEMGFGYYGAALPVARGTFCHADEPEAFQIGPDGTLYACSPARDKHEVEVGRLTEDGTAVLGPAYERWHSTPALGSECRECPYLCFCAGGCRLERLRSSADGSCLDEFADLEGLILNRYTAARVDPAAARQ